ncbi:MAG: nucleotidyltransferase [Vicinamibacteria bacterium]
MKSDESSTERRAALEADPPPDRTRRPDGSAIDPHLRGADEFGFREVLKETVDVLEEARLPYALIGGLASTGWGRPRWTHDIDVFVRREDALRVLEALGARGFETEQTDATWLFKAFKDRVMVDIIFCSTGGFYLDAEMLDRAAKRDFQGQLVRVVPPEDLLIMKAVVHDERGPRHWHDALGIIMGTDLDWDYLERRALRAPRRVLSLLLYAQSIDLTVPPGVIRRLFSRIYD